MVIFSIIRAITHAGTAAIENERLRRKVILCNLLALTVSVVFLAVCVVFFCMGAVGGAAPARGYLFTGLIYGSIVLLNKYGYHTISRIIFNIIPSLNLVVVAGFTSDDVNIVMKFSQLSVVVIPLVLFDIKEKILLAFGITWVVLMFYLTDVVNPYIPKLTSVSYDFYSNSFYINFNAGLAFFFIVLSFLYLQWLNVKAEDISRMLYEETLEQKMLILQKNQKITDSLDYATYIQQALLSQTDVLELNCKEFFLIYKPKDIVSGDFYMFKKVGTKLVLIVADGTGHGVPGAFISMLGISFLTEVLRNTPLTQANLVLTELSMQISAALHQHDKVRNVRIGMDVSLLVYDTVSRDAQYAGANRSLFHVRTGSHDLVELRGDRSPIGIFDRGYEFSNHRFTIAPGDCVYMFTDGFKDQLGGQDGKQLKKKSFKDTIVAICESPMSSQRELLERVYDKWRGSEVQTDDILVLGIRF